MFFKSLDDLYEDGGFVLHQSQSSSHGVDHFLFRGTLKDIMFYEELSFSVANVEVAYEESGMPGGYNWELAEFFDPEYSASLDEWNLSGDKERYIWCNPRHPSNGIWAKWLLLPKGSDLRFTFSPIFGLSLKE